MKKLILTLALVIAMSVPAFAATTIGDWSGDIYNDADYQGTQVGTVAAGKSANGIVFSRHNLSSYGEHYQATTSVDGSKVAQTVITTEVCVFCHTPHFGRVDTAPMWNRGTSASAYTAYGASNQTLAGSSTSVGGSSLACLSCHDGVTTLDNLINKPGKGSGTTGTGTDAGWMFSEITSTQTIGGDITTANSRLNIGANNAGSRNTGNVDLSNDHPIGVIYNAPNVASLRLPGTVISSIQMNNAKANVQGQEYGRSDNLWSVRGFISNTAAITDLLRDGNMVQCASCHDPHYKNQTNTDPSVVAAAAGDPYVGITSVENDGLFLRRVGGNSNSGVCRTCHNK